MQSTNPVLVSTIRDSFDFSAWIDGHFEGTGERIVNVNPGTRSGPHEIISSAGAGGMGEVYKARGTPLSIKLVLVGT